MLFNQIKSQVGKILHKVANNISPDSDYLYSVKPSQPWAFVKS
jgi:hypothetical protein